jgi:hypothetical protein
VASDPFAELRTHLHASINDAIAGLEYSHSQLLGQRVSALSGPDSDDAFLPALLCATTAEALGAPPDVALAAATALALVETSAYVVDDLVIAGSGSDVEPRGLIGNWGVPRTLNAADGFFALAHDSLVQLHRLGFDAGRVLGLADELNEGCRAWAEESDARLVELLLTQHPSTALLITAVRLGAGVAGYDGNVDLLTAALSGSDSSSLRDLPGLEPPTATRLAEAASYIAGVPRT